jgi:hypothetical protein
VPFGVGGDAFGPVYELLNGIGSVGHQPSLCATME